VAKVAHVYLAGSDICLLSAKDEMVAGNGAIALILNCRFGEVIGICAQSPNPQHKSFLTGAEVTIALDRRGTRSKTV
jgi:hypothetical protein